MNTQIHFTNSLAKASAMAILTMAGALVPALAQTVDPATPPEGWVQIGQPIHMSTSTSGSADLSSLTHAVSRSKSKMMVDVNLTVYKTKRDILGYEYYAVTGTQRHSVQGYDSNWVSLGYYGKEMALSISGNGAYLAEYGPESTVGVNTTQWSVGGGVQADGDSVGANLNFSFGKSFSSPNVRFQTSAGNDTLTITTKLPGDLGAPKEPSYAGYLYYPVAIFRVEKGAGLNLTVSSAATWQFEYTRLVVNDKITKINTGYYSADFSNKQLRNGSGTCMTASGSTVISTWCDASMASQKWSTTQAGQLQSFSNGQCLDKAAFGSAMVTAPCDGQSSSQRYVVGFNGLGVLPGIAMGYDGGNVIKTASAANGAAVRWEVRDSLADTLEMWRVQ